MQPPSTHTSPELHAAASPLSASLPHGVTQCSSTHVVPPVHSLPLSVHGVGFPVHTPFTSHENPVGHALLTLHVGVHTPSTHCDPEAHWVKSEHWFAAAVQIPLKHFAPAPPHSESL